MVRLLVCAALWLVIIVGWSCAGWAGAALGTVVGLALLVKPWNGLPLWAWVLVRVRRNEHFESQAAVTVTNDHSAGGIRYQDDIVVTAIQLLGNPHRATVLIGSNECDGGDTIDIAALPSLLRSSLGLTFDSLSVISAGARRSRTGDFPRVYDTFIGGSPYAGQRETWLILRIRALANAAELQSRATVGAAALAATQRFCATLCCSGMRARIATSNDLVELEKRLGITSLEPHNRRRQSLRGDGGWLTSYSYRTPVPDAAMLSLPWSLRTDGIIQNITIFPDLTATATVTLQTPQPPTAPASVTLRTLPFEQHRALARNMCRPLPTVRRLNRGPLPPSLRIPVTASGVLLGKLRGGDRLLLPLSHPTEQSHIHIAADEAIAKRLIIRAAAAGERIVVHTSDAGRWASLRMPGLLVGDLARTPPGTSISVIDGTISPTSRAATVMSIGSARSAAPDSTDVVITQTGPATVLVESDKATFDLEVEFFRAENRYAA